MNLHIVILAAGQGKRMYSDLPKILHPLAGKPLVQWVLDTAQQLNPSAIHLIYGHGGQQIMEAMPNLNINWVNQKEQLGTGHAVMQALEFIPEDAQVLVLSADVPLIQLSTLQALIECAQSTHSGFALLTATLQTPFGLGRILRDDEGNIVSIVEEKDATPQQKGINEIYTGICCVKAANLATWLPQLNKNNAQNEYYLTDIFGLASRNGLQINALITQDWMEIQGVNNRLQLQQLEREWQKRQAFGFLEQGVGIADAQRFDLRGQLICGKDVFIDINCVFTGRVILGDKCIIGPNCSLKDVTLESGCEILANSVLEGCNIGNDCKIGPFARLRAGTQLGPHCKIGNFVETKKALFASHCKASHLSYLGDVDLGTGVNIGAGTITCNYDGVNKHQTVIEAGAFIGSDTQLVAPVTIGKNATIGAGSTIRKNAPAEELTYTESIQRTLYGWKRPKKKQ
ncbi:MAG: bifunctional UDP-N-acetylglucosamine diphosphorylase/glucosamine-1-phosphate N-acetyltransferase GlmU [Legionella sp.]|nr:bifunctional UDP-N-acetylglucosamine diphosphorylase/glucosamine-1-phosphate N-acetyltransferase GlmU [Legionella sp.]